MSLPMTPRGVEAARARAWKFRRVQLLQEACSFIAALLASGVKNGDAIKQASQKFRNRSLGNGRVLNLSRKSAERIHYAFQKRGVAAFALKYVAGRKYDIDPLLLRLVTDTAIRQSKSVSEILVEAGVSDRRGRPSFATIYRNIPATEIAKFLRAERGLLRQRKTAEGKLAAIQQRLCSLRAQAEEKLVKGSA